MKPTKGNITKLQKALKEFERQNKFFKERRDYYSLKAKELEIDNIRISRGKDVLLKDLLSTEDKLYKMQREATRYQNIAEALSIQVLKAQVVNLSVSNIVDACNEAGKKEKTRA